MPRARGPLENRTEESVDPSEEVDRLDTLYRRHAGWLRAGLRRRLGASSATGVDDLVQETYARAATLRRDTIIRHPRALLMRIASRLIFDQARAMRREADLCLAEPQTEPEQDAQLLLKQVILELPKPLRDVFLLSRFGGLTYEQIAARTGLAVKTVEWRMSRALALCAARLKG